MLHPCGYVPYLEHLLPVELLPFVSDVPAKVMHLLAVYDLHFFIKKKGQRGNHLSGLQLPVDGSSQPSFYIIDAGGVGCQVRAK